MNHRSIHSLTLLSAALLAVQACAPAVAGPRYSTASGAAIPATLATTASAYMSAWRADDPAALGRFFAENGVLVARLDPPLRGRAEIVERWLRPALPAVGGDFRTVPERFVVENDAIMEIGRFSYTLTRAGEQTRPVSGLYSQLWRRQPDGNWQVQGLMVH